MRTQRNSSVPFGLSGIWDGPPLQGHDYPLEYYEDGYPKLPSCLDRRASKT